MSRGPAVTGQYFPGSRCKPINHGTAAGYRAHSRHGVPVCGPCRAAERARKGYQAPQKVAQCGTRSGYTRHLKRGEATCPACRAAHNAFMSTYMKAHRRQQSARVAEEVARARRGY